MEVVRDTLHGTVVTDPYRWLENKDAPETRAWLAEQERYLHQVMAAAPGHDKIRARLEQLMRVDDVAVPTERAGRLFYLKRGAREELRSLVVRTGPAGREQVLMDPTTLSKDGSVSLRILDVADDGSKIAVGIQKGGEDEVEVVFLDVATRKPRADRLPRARYPTVQFSGDGKSVYYSRSGREGPRVLRHVLGAAPERDPLLFGDGLSPALIATVSVSDTGDWLLITVSHGSAGDQVELYAKDVRHDGKIVTIVNDLVARFDGRIGGDTLYVRTNWNAPRYRILAIALRHPERESWREVVKEGPSALESWALAGGRLVINYVVNVVSQLYLVATNGRVLGAVQTGDVGAVRMLTGSWSRPDVYLSFESFNVPTRIFRVNATTNSTFVWWSEPVPFRGEDYVVDQAWYATRDGTRVPMFISHRRDMPRDGKRPVYLTGYGGFAVSRTPHFSAEAALWMENGGVWVEPSLRGGGEFGEAWHKAGMLDRKQNVFDDFESAAEWLIKNRFTSSEHLAIAGGSNGGLLVGAALTQRPDLFRAVVCSVPLLDMLRYHKFLVARFWVPEYGSSEDSAQFRALYGYSPYQAVRIGEQYPAVMFVSGDSDTRVDPLHARKMTALLQSATGSDKPVVLDYDTRSGHSGGKPMSQQIEDNATHMQFLFWQLGMTPRDGAPPPLPPPPPSEEAR
jgi:prolyl oligopeptidase